MLQIQGLKEKRAARTDALRAIVAKAEAEKRDLTEDEQVEFDNGKTAIEALEKSIARAEFLAEAERRMDGEPVGGNKKEEYEWRQFSISKAIASQIPGLNVDAGREKEISQELERRSGRPAQGMLCPVNVFEKRVDVVTTGLPALGPGSNVIATDWRGDQFIDLLRTQMVAQRLGARVISGLVGNVDIPKLKASATAYWVAENAAITASDMQFDKVSLTPKHVGALIEISRNMVLQSSPDVEGIIRNDFAALLARGLDLAALVGGGSNQPSGIIANAANVNDITVGTSATAAAYADIVGLVAAIADSNALGGSLGFAANSATVGKLALTLKDAADTSSNYIVSDIGAGTLAGYPLAMTNQLTASPNSAMIFADWTQLLIGYWSAFDLLVNPYETTAYSKGNILVRGFLTADVQLRQPKSFAIRRLISTA